METNEVKAYVPFHPVHPFEILKEELEARGISQKEFAESIGMKASNFNRMLKAKGELSSEMAIKLEDSLGIPYSHWMGFQEKFIRDQRMIEQRESSENSAKKIWNYLKEYVSESLLKNAGVITDTQPSEKVKSVFRFFQVETLEEFVALRSMPANAMCRKSEKLTTDENALFTWKYLCINKSKDVPVNGNFDKGRLPDIRRDINKVLRDNTDVVENTAGTLASYGIKFVVAEKYGKIPVDGLSFWKEDNPTIAVSLRHRRIDNFAFTVYHELGHIMLHLSQRNGEAINPTDEKNRRLEKEADDFAQQSLIPQSVWREFVKGLRNQYYGDIEAYINNFSTRYDIHPRIVYGRYCHELDNFRHKVNIPYQLS